MTKKGQAYRRMVLCDLYAKYGASKPNLSQPFEVEMIVVPPDRRRRDIDNVCKTLFDALTLAGMWQDDKLIRKLTVTMAEPSKPGWIDLKIIA